MLSLPTCVGLGYGRPVDLPSSFSWKYGVTQFGVRNLRQPLITPQCLIDPRLSLRVLGVPPTRLNREPSPG